MTSQNMIFYPDFPSPSSIGLPLDDAIAMTPFNGLNSRINAKKALFSSLYHANFHESIAPATSRPLVTSTVVRKVTS